MTMIQKLYGLGVKQEQINNWKYRSVLPGNDFNVVIVLNKLSKLIFLNRL